MKQYRLSNAWHILGRTQDIIKMVFLALLLITTITVGSLWD